MKKIILLFVLAFPLLLSGQEAVSPCKTTFYPIKPAVQIDNYSPGAGGISFVKKLPNTSLNIKAKEGFQFNVGIQFFDIDCFTQIGPVCTPYAELDLSKEADFEVVFTLSSPDASFDPNNNLSTVTKGVRFLRSDKFTKGGVAVNPVTYYSTYESLATTIYMKNSWEMTKGDITLTMRVNDINQVQLLRDPTSLERTHTIVYTNTTLPTNVVLDVATSTDQNNTWSDLPPKSAICFQYRVTPDIGALGAPDYEGNVVTEKCNNVTSGDYFSINDIKPGLFPNNTSVDDIASSIFFNFYTNQVSNSWVIDNEDFFSTMDCHGGGLAPIRGLIEQYFTTEAINANKVGLIIHQRFLSGNLVNLASTEVHRKEINLTGQSLKAKKKHL